MRERIALIRADAETVTQQAPMSISEMMRHPRLRLPRIDQAEVCIRTNRLI